MSSCAASAASQPKQPAPLETLVTLCRYVEGNLTARDLGAEKLASAFGLSRATLYRLFEPVGGVRPLFASDASPTPTKSSPRRASKIVESDQSPTRRASTALQPLTAPFALPMETRHGTYVSERAGSLSLKRPDEIGVLARWLLETTA
jgi:AraC-like DNA-binding protein